MKQYKIKVNDQEYMVEVEEITDGNQATAHTSTVTTAKQQEQKETIKKPEVKSAPKPETKKLVDQGSTEGEEIQAPMPGKILKINVSEGDSVNEGDTVLILEAMKMENEIVANNSGKVKKISVSVNDMVETDDILMVIG
jgi:glutaconyl-CoA/methylmalonyl-CoA decarboxylase subunit gamma